MPPTRTPIKPPRAAARAGASKAAAAKAPAPSRSPLARAFSRFRRPAPSRGAGQRSATGQRAETIGTFLRDTRNELRKVEWPSRQEGIKLTGAVVGLSVVVGVFLGGVDFIFQEFFKALVSLTGGG